MISKLVNKTQCVVQKIFNDFYERKLQKRLKNDNFTILCSNCIGGVIYHRLNKKFLSPTINLWMHQPDFLKFVMTIKPTSKLFGEQYLDKDWLGMRSFEKHFDFVNWLNA